MPDKQNFNSVIDTERLTVRRLTPLECERLQGFPDGWTDIGAWVGENGKSHAESADTARYKALGNSIALPPWAYVLTRLSLCVGCGHPTMAMADVEIMLEQLRIIYGNRSEVDTIKAEKLLRLSERLEVLCR